MYAIRSYYVGNARRQVFAAQFVDDHPDSAGIVRNRVDQNERTGLFVLFIRIEEKWFGSC